MGQTNGLHFTAAATAQVSYTSNVEYGTGQPRRGDFIGALTGTVGVAGTEENLHLNGSVALTAQVDGHGNFSGSVAPIGSVSGTLKAIDNWLLIDAAANFAQSYTSPFGPQPQSLTNDTINRYTSQTYNIAPHISGVLPGEVSYTVRDDNTWTTANSYGSTAAKPPATYSNNALASLSSSGSRVGWSIDYNRSYYDSGVPGGNSWTEDIRASLPVRITDEFRLGPRIGYEKAKLLGQHFESTIYGVQANWAPTDRTSVDGYWEHRFFGDAYSLNISHRLPRISLTASFSRDLSNYPSLALTVPPTQNVSSYVDAALRTRIPDPAQRATAVQQFMARSGLPSTLFGPVNFYSTTFLLSTSEAMTAAWLGLRNSASLTIFHSKSESLVTQDPALIGSFVPEELQFSPNNTQVGAGVNFGRTLSSQSSLGVNANISRVTSDSATFNGPVTHAVNAFLNATYSTQFASRTSGSFGTGYSWYSPSGSPDVHRTSAWNVYASITHTFR